MNLENQVTSLELSKKLKELGVKQESLYTWLHHNHKEWKLVLGDAGVDEPVHAYTVAELGELLPRDNGASSSTREVSGDFRCGNQIEENEAEARGKMLEYLIEDELIPPQDK